MNEFVVVPLSQSMRDLELQKDNRYCVTTVRDLSREDQDDVLGRLANPAALACADKRYEADSASREPPTSQLGWSFPESSPNGGELCLCCCFLNYTKL